ncbi:hypothetical protein K435DRAFT_860510 [Dendrothele bispora CBS 962.96]|uniref:Uncharacterized protein n=1 Tax=Dendrothele bispora (strain CBS 962.96) TaxID=1314807 RepID=A0A4S8LYB9_DENBC|nr:hypothetical protein K435DRAFT_860510 [Dendrothele bispora CBS 962.96]
MALTQSARLPGPGPSWDEEVVPVLRQRLENESRTLARRISAISASSNEDVNEYRNHNHNTTTNSNNSRSNSSGKSSTNYGSASAPRPSSSRSRTYSQPYQYHVETNPTSSARSKYVNGHISSSNAPSTPSSAAAAAAARSISPRPSTSTDSHNYSTPPKPSRIPQPTTRTRASSITAAGHTQFPPPGSTLGSPYSGGGGGASSVYAGSPHTPTQDSSRSADLWIVHEQQQSPPPPSALPPHSRHHHHHHHHHPNSTNPSSSYFPPPSSSSSSSLTNSAAAVVAAAHRVPGLLHEPAPFSPPGSQSSSTLNHSSQENGINGFVDPPRPSIDSQEEERPFEHWYRGEVSRNGGVGELRVGKRQEMLEIASYGYDLSESPSPSGRMRTGGGGRERNAITEAIEEERERRRRIEMMRRQQQQQQVGRRRADSMGSLDDRETEERRASFYMDPEKARQVERVMDEGPLTDLEGDDYEYRHDGEELDMDEDGYRYYDAEEDYHEGERTKTPTSYAYNTSSSGTKSEPSLLGTANNTTASNANANAGAGGSSAAKGRMTPTSGPGRGGGTKSPTSNSKSPSTPTQRPGGARQRQISASSRTPNSTTPGGGAAAAKRAASSSPSPSTPSKSPSSNSRLAASKATQAKLAAAKRQKMLEGDSRRSVGQYDLSKLSAGEEGLDGVDADAIPKWTVPVTKAGSGGWDDVILPVVARNQGLNGHFETADGSPRPMKDMEGEIVPAPGTFGYDHSKYRPPRDFSDPDAIPMDEFGVGKDRGRLLLRGVQEEEQNRIGEGEVSAHDQTRLPIRNQQPLSTTTTRMGVPQSSASASPVPFADYAPRRGGPVGLGIVDATGQQQQMVDLEAQRTEKEQQQQIEEEESGGGGCCKCIVM